MGVNPLEENVFSEGEIARRQYDALLKYTLDPKGLGAKLDKMRRGELEVYEHSFGQRAWLKIAKVATLGIYSHDERAPHGVVAELDRNRRAQRQIRFLHEVEASGPDTEVVWNLDEVKRALDDLATTGVEPRGIDTKALSEKTQKIPSVNVGGE